MKEYDIRAETNESIESVDGGFRLRGLKDIQGTFSGPLTDEAAELLSARVPTQLFLYGPDPNLPFWKHWFYRIRSWLTTTPYPPIVLASGPATVNFEREENDEGVVFTVSFTSDGRWYIHSDDE